ncbi:MAG: hypothetical protein K2R98_18105 [Gemmataceae bacterium]|nr:hypothetical protein [Gemmataceae bacterium]
MLNSIDILGVAVALAAALVLTPLVRLLARRWGLVSQPRGDRWAKKPTALLGGVAIFASIAVAHATFLPEVPHGWVVLGASAFLFAVGLVDDIRNLKPYQKLVAQLMAAALVVMAGLTLPWTGSALVNMALTVFWLVGITNAVNLLDNMDGLAAGVGAIAAGFLAASFFASGQTVEGLFLTAFAATLIGFLVYNFNPASIFMGDCGSMFIGFFLASAALLHVTGGRSRGVVPVLAVPVLLLLIPIFDTTLVTLVRKLAGRAVSQGGRDHTSHRLVALGLSERKAVCLLYALAALAGLVATLVRHMPADVALAVLAAFTIGLTLLGIHLAGVKVYEESAERTEGKPPLVAFLVDLSYKRRVFEVLLDVVLIGLAYYLANLLVFGPLHEEAMQTVLVHTLPVLVCVKLFAFLAAGVYRGVWRYVGLSNLAVYVKGVVGGSALSVLVLLALFRFEGFSRAVFVLDGLLLLALLCGSRFAFRLLRNLLPGTPRSDGQRALIYGADDEGELLLRVMRHDATLRCVPVGFVDDDPMKKGKIIHGLRVFGGNGAFETICREQRIEVVYVSATRVSVERLEELRNGCIGAGAALHRMRIVIEPVETSETDSL